jgi:hypothetical protein
VDLELGDFPRRTEDTTHQLPSNILFHHQGICKSLDSPHVDKTSVLWLNPISTPYPIPDIPEHVLHDWLVEFVHPIRYPFIGLVPKHFVHLNHVSFTSSQSN